MGCANGKEEFPVISNSKKLVDLLPQVEAQIPPNKKGKLEDDDFDEIKLDPTSRIPKYRTKIDSRVTAKYDIKALIGKGSFSDVLRVESKTSRQPYAVKVVKVANIQEQEVVNAELDSLRRIEHPYVIKLHEVVISKECSYLIMQLATGGELYDKVKSRGYLDEKYSCNITQMLISGLLYLHSAGIIHRDLKPENLLFYHPGPDSKILITDFGFSKVSEDEHEKFTTWCGTPEYIAPELLLKKPYDKKVDLWSLGVIIFVMLSGHLPFSGDTAPKLFKQILEGSYSYTREVWRNVSASARDFIDQLLQTDPEIRSDALSASTHSWLKAYPVLHKLKHKVNKKSSVQGKLSSLNDFVPLRTINKTVDNISPSESSSESQTWLENMYNKKGAAKNRIILPFNGEFPNVILTKDKILEDNASSVTRSNVDSMLATEDTNSVVSDLHVLQEFYKKYATTSDPEMKEQLREEYLETMRKSNLRLPIQFGTNDEPNTKADEPQPSLSFKDRKLSVHDRKLSVHQQFENIDEYSEDEEVQIAIRPSLSKLDRIYGNSSSLSSGPSLKLQTIPIQPNNLRYIEKVGVWLNDQNDGKKEKNYKTDIDPNNLLSTRTVSGKSINTISDNSQASSFNRFLLPTTSKRKLHNMNLIQKSSDLSSHHSDSTKAFSLANSFNSGSTAIFRPLIIQNGHTGSSMA